MNVLSLHSWMIRTLSDVQAPRVQFCWHFDAVVVAWEYFASTIYLIQLFAGHQLVTVMELTVTMV